MRITQEDVIVNQTRSIAVKAERFESKSVERPTIKRLALQISANTEPMLIYKILIRREDGIK